MSSFSREWIFSIWALEIAGRRFSISVVADFRRAMRSRSSLSIPLPSSMRMLSRLAMACSTAANTELSKLPSNGAAAPESAPGIFKMAFRSGSELMANSLSASRKAWMYPPISSLFNENPDATVRSMDSVSSTCPRWMRSFRSLRSLSSSASVSPGMRKCKSRKRWFTDFSEMAKPGMASVASPLACANAVMERMGMGQLPVAGCQLPVFSSSFKTRAPKYLVLSINRNGFQVGELHLVQLAIEAQAAHQFVVRADVSDCSRLDHHDAIGAAHGRKPVRDHKD